MLLSWNKSALSIRHFFTVSAIAVFLFSNACKNDASNRDRKETIPADKKTLVDINKKMVKSEDQRIADFIERYHWKMDETGSGLRYMIYHHGKGPRVKSGDEVVINYTEKLLTGEMLYSSDTAGPKKIVLGKGEVEKGLEEGILLLNKGDRAKFIIPSHLAYGLVGDGKKIPAKATLVYDIEILDIK